MTTLARKVETMRQRVEDGILEILQLTAQPGPPDVEAIQARALRALRQSALEAGETVMQLRMAATEGAALAQKVWNPTAGYDDLPEDVAKAYKELKKEQEKEAKAQGQQQSRGGGGPYRGYYHRGRSSYYQPY